MTWPGWPLRFHLWRTPRPPRHDHPFTDLRRVLRDACTPRRTR